jgi:hypothetical protein
MSLKHKKKTSKNFLLSVAKLVKTLRACVWGLVRTVPKQEKQSPYVDEYR